MLFFRTGSTDPTYNLAFEQYLFDTLPRGASALGLWQNDNAVIIGRHQDTAAEIDPAYVAAHGIRVVRRTTGGGAVFHDLGNLNFTYIADHPEGARFDFAFFTRPVIDALAALGVRAELSSRNDLSVDGRKISGNAQFHRDGRVLHHGTLLFAADLEALSGALRPSPEKLASRGVASARARVANISEFLAEPMTMTNFHDHLLRHLSTAIAPVYYAPAAADLAAIAALRSERYATDAWNWGASPRYNIKRQTRFPGGGLAAYLWAENGILREIALCGDFFATEELPTLTNALVGAPLTAEGIAAALAPLGDPGRYVHGLDAQTLLALLTKD